MKLLVVVILDNFLQTYLNEVSCNIQNIDRMREVAQNVDESFGHLSTHTEVCIFSL